MDIPVATPEQYEREMRFELALQAEARTAFINSMVRQVQHKDGTTSHVEKNLAELPAGRRLIHTLIGDGETYGVLKGIRDFRAESLQVLKEHSGRGEVSLCRLVVAERSAEELAFIIAHTLISTTAWNVKFMNVGSNTHIHVGCRMANLIKDSIDLSEWVYRCKQDAKENGTADPSKYMLASVKGEVTTKTWQRWKRKLGLIMEPWTIQTKYQIGIPLTHIGVENSGGLFVFQNKTIRGRTQKIVTMSDEGQQVLSQYVDDSIMGVKTHRAMVCPPVAWRKKGTAND